MMIIKLDGASCFLQSFSAVGHGTFMYGIINDGSNEFCWVYDCGSKRSTRISREIDEFCELWGGKIDLLVISHFDDDHINGIEQLLRKKLVKVLVLPYLDIASRLKEVSAIDGEACSGSTAIFQLNPLRWLELKGLSNQVESVVFVRGGQGAGEVNDDGSLDRSFDEDYSNPMAASKSVFNISLLSHKKPLEIRSAPVNFMFFNAVNSGMFIMDGAGNRVTRRSKVDIKVLNDEIFLAIKKSNLDKDSGFWPKNNWRDFFRDIYDRHFGKSSHSRNNISLCMLSTPLACCCYMQISDGLNSRLLKKRSLLCLGDLSVNKNTVIEMKKHFGKILWDDISGVQIPHHGSRYSWELGCANEFNPEYFVNCVPDTSINHPHKNVMNDLAGFEVFSANYSTKVTIGFKFEYCLCC